MSSPTSIPPSNRPAGVPGSGNATYAIVAVVMVGAAIALVTWRSCLNHEVAAVPVPSATAAPSSAPTNSRLDDIPMPPPVEEKPEAGPSPKIVYVPAGGCEGKCSGTLTPELEQALQIRGVQTRRCYNQALSQDSTLKGRVTITVRVGPAGNLCSVNVTSNDMGTPGVANCAANIFRSSQGYPAPRGGCVELGVPLSFVPQGQ